VALVDGSPASLNSSHTLIKVVGKNGTPNEPAEDSSPRPVTVSTALITSDSLFNVLIAGLPYGFVPQWSMVEGDWIITVKGPEAGVYHAINKLPHAIEDYLEGRLWLD
jgi:hypothetical protein